MTQGSLEHKISNEEKKRLLKLVNKSVYAKYNTANYGANAIVLTIGNLTLYFSYDTIVAFENENELVICENVFSNTTGRHLNLIDRNKKKRISYGQFVSKLEEVLETHNLRVS